MKLFTVIRNLTANPGAEPDPEGWLTRYVAHCGVGFALFAVTLPLTLVSPLLAAFLAVLAYGLIEAYELKRAGVSRALVLDCLLDWYAALAGTTLAYALWTHDGVVAFATLIAATLVAEAGVRARLDTRVSTP